MLTAVIVDDKPANIQTLKEMFLSYCPTVTVVGSATDIDSAYLVINQVLPEVVFLDIEMTGGTGFDLLQKFRSIPFEVIFTTAYDQYAIRAFRENALDYLLKPIDIDALQQAVIRAEKHIGLKQTNDNLARYLQQSAVPFSSKISLPVQDGYLFVDYHEIVRCEASGSYSNIYLTNGEKIIVSMRLKECEDILPSRLFFRVHHSHVINLQCVSRYVRGRGGYVHMKDGTTVEVSINKKDAFLEAIKFQS
ncbi:LytR/AlgR family response regulator transcription factor [Chitinophagaceae bacterium MMS25-I14]